MSSKTMASRQKKINLTRVMVAFLSDCLFLERKMWDKVNGKKYHRLVTDFLKELKYVNPFFHVTIEGGILNVPFPPAVRDIRQEYKSPQKKELEK